MFGLYTVCVFILMHSSAKSQRHADTLEVGMARHPRKCVFSIWMDEI